MQNILWTLSSPRSKFIAKFNTLPSNISKINGNSSPIPIALRNLQGISNYSPSARSLSFILWHFLWCYGVASCSSHGNYSGLLCQCSFHGLSWEWLERGWCPLNLYLVLKHLLRLVSLLLLQPVPVPRVPGYHLCQGHWFLGHRAASTGAGAPCLRDYDWVVFLLPRHPSFLSQAKVQNHSRQKKSQKPL